MPQAVDEAGNIWETDAQGNPVRWIGRQQSQQVPRTIPLPPTPRQQAQENRDTAAAGRDEVRTGIAARGEGRDVAKMGFDQAKDLRSEFNNLPDVKDYRAAIKAYSSALKSSETPAGDLNLIYAFAKIMDPNSVVREGEQAAVAGGDSMAGQITARLKKELEGTGTFRPEYRNQLRRELQTRISELNTAYDSQRQHYEGFARQLGVDPNVVVGEHDGTRFYNEIKDYWSKQGPVVSSAMDAAGNPLPNGAHVGEDRFTRMPGYRQSIMAQGMSGVNAGIANTIGAPIDIATAAMNLVPRGINTVANTRIPTIRNPVLGSDYIKQKMAGWGIYDPTNDPNAQFARRVGESFGGALVPLGGAGASASKVGMGLLGAIGGGVGAATAQQVFPGNPVAEFGGELLGSGLTGGGLLSASRNMRQRKIEAKVPTIPQLKQQAGDLYRQAESRGITASPDMTKQLADNLQQVLQNNGQVSPTGRISDVYPKVKEAMQLAQDYSGRPMNPTQMQTVRSVMTDGLSGMDKTERRTAKLLTNEFDAWANPQAPELAQARNIANRYINAQKLAQARELAAARAGQFTGSGFENALRTEYRGLDRKSVMGRENFSDPLNDAIENVSRGTPASNLARNVGRFAPTGPVSSMATLGPAALATSVAGPAVGAGVGALVGGTGALGRVAATRMGIRQADIAELIARNGGPIQQAPLVDPETQRAITAVLLAQQANAYNSDRKKRKPQQR